MQDQIVKVDALRPIAKELGCTLAQLALAWCANNPNVSTVITGATKLSQVCLSGCLVRPKLAANCTIFITKQCDLSYRLKTI